MSLTPKQTKKLISSLIEWDVRPAYFIWGPPGVGKTAVASQAAEEAEIGFINMRLALKDPTDLRGIPVPRDEKALWLPPSELPDENSKKRGIVFLDEINLAPPLVQSSAYQFVFEGRIGEYVLPEGWFVIAAGNRHEDGAHDYRMAMPLLNRFIHVDYEANIDDWREWAVNANIATEVMEFMSFREDLLFKFDAERDERSFPTPRSWEMVSHVMRNYSLDDREILSAQIKGAVGEGAGTEFLAYLDMRKELPDIEKIFAGENILPPKDKIDIACALGTALALRATPQQFNRVLEYSLKLPAEVAVITGKLLAVRDDEAVTSSDVWLEWVNEYYDLFE